MKSNITTRRKAMWAALALAGIAAGCGSSTKTAATPTTAAPAAITAATAAVTTSAAATTAAQPAATTSAAPATTKATSGGAFATFAPGSNAAIVLAVNPWTGSGVDANVAKIVLEKYLGTKTTLTAIDENVSWTGLDAGSIDANLEVWPSGHVNDYATYVTQKKSVLDIGKLGPVAKIGWYVPSFVIDEHPDLATLDGFKDPKNAKLFATAETGDKGQFLMGDPSYVSYDKEIIDNLKLPLDYIVAGSEAAEVTAIQKAIADHTPLLFQFWQPQWLQSQVKLTEVKLPPVTDACKAAAAAADHSAYNCDYPPDVLYKVATGKLESKNKVAFAFLSKFQLTTDQQNQISTYVDSDKMDPAAAAQKWVDANANIVSAWLAA
jgi:glycine betaine/proline transport system substrate-binding protein